MDDKRDSRIASKTAAASDGDPDDNAISIAGMKLMLIRQQITRKNEYATFYGVVRNVGTVPIPDGEVTILEINHDGYQIGEIPGVLDVDPLPPGRDSTFQVEFPIRDADARWGHTFKSAGGPEIPTVLAPSARLVLK